MPKPKVTQNTPKIDINLIPQDPFVESLFGQILTWALSIGRYIVIFTELIVILTFLSRFKLDRELTDLNEAILRQKTIIQSYQDTENLYRSTQEKVNFLKKQQTESEITSNFKKIEVGLPIDTKLQRLVIQPDFTQMTISALSAQSMKSTIDQFVKSNPQNDVIISDVKYQSSTGYINFELRIDRKKILKQSPVKNTTTEKVDL